MIDISVYNIILLHSPLRSSLRDEENNLLEEIEYIKMCIEEEVDTKQKITIEQAMLTPPSMTELKVFRTKIEDMLKEISTKVRRIVPFYAGSDKY